MSDDKLDNIIKLVNKIASVYKVECLSATKNEEGKIDIEISRLLMRGDWKKMETKIRRLIPNASDIFVKEKF